MHHVGHHDTRTNVHSCIVCSHPTTPLPIPRTRCLSSSLDHNLSPVRVRHYEQQESCVVVHQTHHSDTRENHQQTRQDANKLQVTNLQEHQDHNYSYPIALPRLCSSSSSFSSFTSTQAHYGHYQWRYKPTHSALTCLSRAAKPDTRVCAPWHNPVTFHHQMQAVPQA